MPEPTLAALLTRIEILERHVERLEQAITRRDKISVLDFPDVKYRELLEEDGWKPRHTPSPSQTRGSVADPDRALGADRYRSDTEA